MVKLASPAERPRPHGGGGGPDEAGSPPPQAPRTAPLRTINLNGISLLVVSLLSFAGFEPIATWYWIQNDLLLQHPNMMYPVRHLLDLYFYCLLLAY